MMDSKKILIVSRWFYPENSPRAFRASELAKELALQGHNVMVLAPANGKSLDEYSQLHGFKIVDLGKLTWKNPNFGKRGIGYIITRIFHRLLSLAFEYPSIELVFKIKNKIRSLGTFDQVISIAVPYPVHWGVALARNRKYPLARTWIADCGDPYMGEKTDTFRKWFHFKYVEKWFMRKADFITIPVKEGIDGYYPEFHSKIRIIPQGFKFSTALQDTFVPNPIPQFAYAGGFIPGVRDPKLFLEFLTTVKSNFIFIIYTQNRNILEPFFNKLGERLIIKDYIPREELLTELGKMDFLVNFDNNTGIQQPSKLIDYALTGRPILNIKGELEPQTITAFLSGDYSKKYEILDIESYRIENVVSKFLELTSSKI